MALVFIIHKSFLDTSWTNSRTQLLIIFYINRNIKKILQLDEFFMFVYFLIKVFSVPLLTVKLRTQWLYRDPWEKKIMSFYA